MNIEQLSKFMLLREIDSIQQQDDFNPNKKYAIRKLQDFCLREIKTQTDEEIRDLLKELFWYLNSQL